MQLCGITVTMVQRTTPNRSTEHKQPVSPVWAVLADLLVGKGAAKHARQYRSVAESFQSLVQAVDQTVEKLEGIVLFT